MNSIQDVREAQQMWEHKIKNAGREGIVLDCGKSRSLVGLLNRIIHSFANKPQGRGGSVEMTMSKSSATS